MSLREHRARVGVAIVRKGRPMHNGAHIEADDIQRIVRRKGPATRLLGIDKWCNIENLSDHDVAHHAREMLSGKRPVPKSDRKPLDYVSRALLAYHGANPDAVEALISVASGIGLHDDHDDRWAEFGVILHDDETYKQINYAKIHSGKLTWIRQDDRAAIEFPAIPQALRIAAKGRALKDVISHRALDEMNIVITQSEALGFDTLQKSDAFCAFEVAITTSA